MMDADDFFDLVDSHPMTDEEATKRFEECNPHNLPHCDEYYRSLQVPGYFILENIEKYGAYTRAWVEFATEIGVNNSWTAEQRKKLVYLEGYFESTGSYWLGG
jgi:hypothetical protein